MVDLGWASILPIPAVQPGVYTNSIPLVLSPHSQPQSFLLIFLLKPEFQHPATVHTSRCKTQAVDCSQQKWPRST